MRADGDDGTGPICPACSRRIPWNQVSFGPVFQCSSCGEELAVPRAYRVGISVIGGALALLCAYVIGTRDIAFLIAFMVAYLPLTWIVLMVAARLAPPALDLGSPFSIFRGKVEGHDRED